MAEKSVIASISQAERHPFKTPQLPALRAVVSEPAQQKRRFFLLLYFQRVGSPPILGENVFQQSSPTSATQRRQGQQTCFGWHGCRPGPIRPTQGLTGANVGEIVWDSMTEGKWILLCQRHIKIQLAQRLWPGSPRFLLSALRPSGRKKWVRASARNCARRIAGRDACPAERQEISARPAERQEISARILCRQHT